MAMSPRLLRPRATGFDPRRIGNLAVWFDASVSSSITLNGSTVSEWRDLSGNGRHAVQATASGQPTYVNSGLSGKSVVEAFAIGKSMKTAAFPAGLPQTVFVVAKATGNSSGIFQRGAINTVHSLLRSTDVFQARRGQFATSTVLSVNSDYNIFTCEFQSNLTRLSVNTLPANDNTSLATGDAAATDDRTLAIFNLDSNFSMTGAIAEVLYYNAALSVSERRSVERYLSRKWGVALYQPPAYSDADANAYITAVEAADAAALETGVRNAINDFIVGCKADGIWSAIKASCILMGARTLSGALTPLVGAAPTNNGPFVSGDYNRKTGLVGNGSTKYLDSNRNNNASPQDSAHLAAFVGEAIVGDASTRALIGTTNATGSSAIVKGSTGNVLQTRLKHVTAASSSTSMAGYSGFVGASRSVSASYLTRISGANSTVSVASSANQDASVLVYALSPSAITGNMRLAFYSIGESLDLALLDARVSALSTAIGAAIP